MLTLKQDAEFPTRSRVLDSHRAYLGHIDQIGPDEWRAFHLGKGGELSPLRPEERFKTLEPAVEAFTTAHAADV